MAETEKDESTKMVVTKHQEQVIDVDTSTLVAAKDGAGPLDLVTQFESIDSMQLTPQVIKHVMKVHMMSTVRQAQINQASGQMHSLNFLMGYSNALKAQELQGGLLEARRDIEHGKLVLMEMQHQLAHSSSAIGSLERTVGGLAEQVDTQEQLQSELSAAVVAQKLEMTDALKDIDEKLSTQQSLIDQQERTLQSLLYVRFRIDFAADTAILLLSWWWANSAAATWLLSPLVSFVSLISNMNGKPRVRSSLQPMAMAVPSPLPGSVPLRRDRQQRLGERLVQKHLARKNQQVVQQLVKLVLVLALFRYLKRVAVYNGLHSMVGSMNSYWSFMRNLASKSMDAAGVPASYQQQLAACQQQLGHAKQHASDFCEQMVSKFKETTGL